MSFIVGDDDSNELCFDEKVFLKETFSIDSFLREHRHKTSLEGLRDDLGTYLKILRCCMIDLINKDYEDFVNLSKDLVGLDKNIEALELPLGNFRQEIVVVRNELEDTINGVRQCLIEENDIARNKNSLINLSQVLMSITKLQQLLDGPTKVIDLDIVERSSMEFNHMQFSKRKCQHILSQDQIIECDRLEKLLSSALGNTFLECLSQKQQNELARCLRIYSSLDKVTEAEDLLRDELIAPFFNPILTETCLQKENLDGIFQKLTDFVEMKLRELLNVATVDFNFILNSFWLELERRFELYLASIFAPGNPVIFHQRFIQSCRFFDSLEIKCKTQEQVDNLRSHAQSQHFFHKWNLPVYFKIRFQEIAGSLELALNDCTITTLAENSNSIFELKSSWEISKALTSCWDDGVFLQQIADKFWKFSLQIIARFIFWVDGELRIKKMTHQRNKSGDAITLTLPPTISEAVRNQLNSFVRLYFDAEKLEENAKTVLETAKGKIPNNSKLTPILDDSINECLFNFHQVLPRIALSIVGTIVSESSLYLNQTRDIPRLFRLTNRDCPTRACDYVYYAIKLPSEFLTEMKDNKIKDEWSYDIFSQLAEHFYQRVDEVLTNAQKTEESLIKLKKAKERTERVKESSIVSVNSNVKTGGPTDDDKIRQQLLIDVQTFCSEAEKLCNDLTRCKQLINLKELVINARERSLDR